MNRRSVVEVTRFEAVLDGQSREMFGVEARWSTSLDPNGDEFVELRLETEVPADPTVTFAELEQRALAQIIQSAELLAQETPASLSRRLRAPNISIVSSQE